MKKNALVTGFDTSAIAREVCLLLLKENYEIVAIYEKDYEPKSEKRVDFEKYNNRVVFEQVNFHSKQSIDELVSRLKNYQFAAIVNCHATLAFDNKACLLHEFFNFDYDEFTKVIQYNITTIAAICIGLKDNIVSGGCVVNVTSSAAEEGAFATISYNASKAAVKNLSKSLANNLGTYRGIRVNCVAPGWIPQSKNVAAGNIVDLANKLTPLTPYGEPKDVAFAVISLINNPYANNATLDVNGGITSSYLMYMLESLDLKGVSTTETMGSLTKLIKDSKDKLK